MLISASEHFESVVSERFCGCGRVGRTPNPESFRLGIRKGQGQPGESGQIGLSEVGLAQWLGW